MEFAGRCRQVCKMESRRLVMVMGLIAIAILVFQSLALPSGNVLSSLPPAVRVQKLVKRNLENGNSSHEPARLPDSSVVPGAVMKTEASDLGVEAKHDSEMNENDPEENFALERDRNPDHNLALDEDGDPDDELLPKKVVDPDDDLPSEKVGHSGNSSSLERAKEPGKEVPSENIGKPGGDFSSNDVRNLGPVLALEKVSGSDNGLAFTPGTSAKISDLNGRVVGKSNMSSIVHEASAVLNTSSTGKQAEKTFIMGENTGIVQSVLAISLRDHSSVARMPILLKRGKPPTTIAEMNRLLQRNRVSPRSVKLRWSSTSDRELLSAKVQIENAPVVKNNRELYSPVFRNVSEFKRSYELMERKLKVYVYREGEKPIFHTPFLRGIYASEGWFMKLMEGNKQFVVKHPRKAHLFYLPFSSRVLRTVMITPESRDRRKLVEFLKTYIDKIAGKYPFWNRTNGADHFLVACHDWAPYETRKDLRLSLRALCNADVSKGFILGKDVSLPVTSVRSSQNPLKNLGGKPASERSILAFFAGNMHGKIRPILLQHWENRDPNMKIFGPTFEGIDGKMTYIHHMKTSKFCICPKGYEVHSPRVVEAIFYECVPVIISDNYVPPFFEVLDWETFSVFVAEKDIPSLKDILLSIPEERYLTMQLRVKKVQQHFLWHSEPVKYDIFHMILHSIWSNRLHQLRTR
ncbi:hypothetical protein AAC387_Pa03g4568 [Persea americana]